MFQWLIYVAGRVLSGSCVNIGSHGAGDPSETLTPLVAWGAGVRSAKYIEPSSTADHSPRGSDSLSLILSALSLYLPLV